MSDFRRTEGEELPLSRRDRKQRLWRRVRVSTGLVCIVGLSGFLVKTDRMVRASGYVTSERYAEVRPAVQGVVAEILARSGDVVEEGQVLVRLEDEEERAARDEVAGSVRRLEAALARREAEIREETRQRESRIAIARLRLEHASAKLALLNELKLKGLASGRAVEDQAMNERLAKAELDALAAWDDTLPAKELAVLRHELESRKDALRRAEALLAARRVRAPIAGSLIRYSFVVGELVRPDLVMYEVFGGDRQILKLRIDERFAALARPGDPYEAELVPFKNRSLRGLRFYGEVEALRGVIESRNNRTYRIAYCSFDPHGLTVPPGTTAEARILVGRTSFWRSVAGLY